MESRSSVDYPHEAAWAASLFPAAAKSWHTKVYENPEQHKRFLNIAVASDRLKPGQ
jgi:hypothetical protein